MKKIEEEVIEKILKDSEEGNFSFNKLYGHYVVKSIKELEEIGKRESEEQNQNPIS